MKDNFELIKHKFDDSIKIIPLADLHLGATTCMLNEIKKTIKYIAETPNVYCTLGGDIIDNGVITGKVASAVYDNVISPLKQVEMATELLRPLAANGKILAVINGNHEERTEKVANISPLYLMCCELGIQDLYRPSMAIIKINLGDRGSTNQCYTLLLHHGKGTNDSALKKDREFVNYFSGVDCIITGHTHNSKVARHKTYEINKFSDTVTERLVTTIITNSFLKEAEYGIKSMLVGADNTVISFDLLKARDKKILVHY